MPATQTLEDYVRGFGNQRQVQEWEDRACDYLDSGKSERDAQQQAFRDIFPDLTLPTMLRCE